MPSLRLLHITDRLSQRGGADVHLLGVLEALTARHTVALAAGYSDGSAESPCPVTFLKGLEARVATPVDLDALLDRFQPDLIHLHNIVNPWVLERLEPHPVAMTLQDHRAFCPGRGKWLTSGGVCTGPMSRDRCARCFDDPAYFDHILDLTERRLAAIRGFRFTVLSRYMQQELAAVGVPCAHIQVIPPFVKGIDLEAPPSGPPCVLFAGRLVDAKGVEDAIAAWRGSGLELPLVIAGTGSQRGRLEAAHPDCEFIGWVPHDQLGGLYRRAAVVIMPSRWQEPFGIVGLEAMTLGVPVAAWDSGGVRDWHPGEGLVPWGDVEGLARAVRALAGRTVAPPTGFEPAALMAKLEHLYEDLLRNRRSPADPC